MPPGRLVARGQKDRVVGGYKAKGLGDIKPKGWGI